MTSFVLGLVMYAAILHAGWNAVLRGGGDRLWSMRLMMVAITMVTVIALPFLPLRWLVSRYVRWEGPAGYRHPPNLASGSSDDVQGGCQAS
jgi:hypothetical protein